MVVFIDWVWIEEYELFGGVCIIVMMGSGFVRNNGVCIVMKKYSWNGCFGYYFVYIYDCIGIVN